MPKARFSIAHKDDDMLALVQDTDQKTLAVWAIDCAERVMPYFEQQFPDDQRPRHAIEALQTWAPDRRFQNGGYSQGVA